MVKDSGTSENGPQARAMPADHPNRTQWRPEERAAALLAGGHSTSARASEDTGVGADTGSGSGSTGAAARMGPNP